MDAEWLSSRVPACKSLQTEEGGVCGHLPLSAAAAAYAYDWARQESAPAGLCLLTAKESRLNQVLICIKLPVPSRPGYFAMQHTCRRQHCCKCK